MASRAGVGGHDVPDEDTVAERVPADAGDGCGIVGDRRADQRLGVEAIPVAPDIADGREALDPGDAVQSLEPLGQALDSTKDGRREDVVGLDDDDGEVVAAEPALHLLVQDPRGVLSPP
jgi:hypothetical protein